MMQIAAIPPLVAQVRALTGQFFLCNEAADALGISAATVRRLRDLDPDRLGPTAEIYNGCVRVDLYDEAALRRLHEHLAWRRNPQGRTRLWTDDERRFRRAAHCAAGYRRRLAGELRDRGDHAGAVRAADHADALVRELRATHAQRSVAVTSSDVT